MVYARNGEYHNKTEQDEPQDYAWPEMADRLRETQADRQPWLGQPWLDNLG